MADRRFRISRQGGKVKLWMPEQIDEEEARLLAEQLRDFCDSPETATVLWSRD
jgi:hypothetical protein